MTYTSFLDPFLHNGMYVSVYPPPPPPGGGIYAGRYMGDAEGFIWYIILNPFNSVIWKIFGNNLGAIKG